MQLHKNKLHIVARGVVLSTKFTADNFQIASALAETIEKSRQEEQDCPMVLRIHQSRLENLLTANGLTCVPVPGDGNCFFASAGVHLDLGAADLDRSSVTTLWRTMGYMTVSLPPKMMKMRGFF
jgi:hypothetical protein